MTRFACLAALLVASAAAAQSYPNRAVKVIVPWTPGQATDIAARVVAQKLQEALGQAFVIDNKPGAGGAIGTDAVAKGPPDGYTLLAASSGPLSIMPNLQKTPYEPLNDLAPISLVAATPFALVTHPAFPANNAKEFIALVKANPGKYTFSSSGTGATAHLFTELFNSMAQIQARHVPYKGSAPAITDIMNGQITYTIETVAATVGHIKAGRLKTFGVSTARRTAAMPDVPPLAETAELPGYDAAAWVGYAFLDHQVVFFRDQRLTPAQFMEFAERMGRPIEYPFVEPIPGFPKIIEVKKLEHERQNFGGIWHSDTTYLEEPPMGSMLLAREVPPYGGGTQVASQYLAYETLAAGTQALLEGLTAVNASAKTDVTRTREDLVKEKGGDGRDYVAEHPVGRTHPETGRQALHGNIAPTVRLSRMTQGERPPL